VSYAKRKPSSRYRTKQFKLSKSGMVRPFARKIKVLEDFVEIDGITYTFGDEPKGYVDKAKAVLVKNHRDYQIDKVGDRYLFTDYESGQWWLEPLEPLEK
jgi:hypothetical protein